MNGRLEAADTLRFERRLAHSVERVWRAITEPDELRHWSPAIPDWKLEPGETFGIEGSDGETGEITELDPPHVLALTWSGQHLRFELRPDGDGCRLVFTHVFDDPQLGAQHAAGWELCFDRLAALLAGTPISESDSLEGWLEVHERYAELFGLDPEFGRHTYAQHRGREQA